jgi:hypothetical protein
MSTIMKDSSYSPIEKIADYDHDLENDSDTTLASASFLSKSTSRRASKNARSTQNTLVWLRWSAILVTQSIMCLLLLKTRAPVWTAAEAETGGDINGLYVPSKSTHLHDYK